LVEFSLRVDFAILELQVPLLFGGLFQLAFFLNQETTPAFGTEVRLKL